VLFRVTNGKSTRDDRAGKIKISTVVEADELDDFFGRYAEVCRGGMDGLRKRDRKARRKNKGGKP
jgi:signal recognition particle subunit SRP14